MPLNNCIQFSQCRRMWLSHSEFVHILEVIEENKGATFQLMSRKCFQCMSKPFIISDLREFMYHVWKTKKTIDHDNSSDGMRRVITDTFLLVHYLPSVPDRISNAPIAYGCTQVR